MIGGMGSAVTPDLSKGGTIDGDLTIGSNSDLVVTGDFKVEGAGSFAFDEIIEGTQVIEKTSTEAFLVRKDSDGGDVFVVDTQDSRVEINGFLKFSNASYIQDIGNNYLKLRIASGDYFAIHGGASDTQYFKVANDGQINTSQLEVSSSNLKYMANGSNANITVTTSGTLLAGTLTTTQLVANATNFKYMANGSNNNLFVNTSGTTVSGTLEIDGGADAIAKITGTTTASRFDYATNSHHRFWQLLESDGRFRLYDQTNGAERMSITSAGNVGIGTTSPTEKLHIIGGLAVEETGSSSGTLKFKDTDQALLGQIGLARTTNDIATGSANLDMVYQLNYNGKFMWSQQNTNRMTLTSTGLGIGTLSPSQKLHVYDGSSSVMMSVERGDGSNGVISAGGSTTFIGTGDATDIEIGTNLLNSAQTMMFFDHSENKIGIGTTAPNALLSLGVDLTSTSTPSLIISDNPLYRGEFGYSEASSTQMWFNNSYDNANSVMQFRMAGSTKMTLTGDGKVGIGTTSPSVPLHVSNTNSTTLRLQNTGGALNYIQMDNSAGTSYIQGNATTIGLASTGDVRLIVNSNIRMKVDDNSRISLSNNDSGASNTIFGKSAGANLDAGSNYNTFIGEGVSDASMDDAQWNTGVGNYALSALTSGDANTALGNNALNDVTTGGSNVAIGSNALDELESGSNNVAIGKNSINQNTVVSNVVAIGHESMGGVDNANGIQSVVAIGRNALYGAVGTTTNINGTIAIGRGTLESLTTGAGNTAVGYESLKALTTGTGNTVLGYQALIGHVGGHYNTAIGWKAMDDTDSGGNAYNSNNNVAIGANALGGTWESLTTEFNVAVGNNTMSGSVSGATQNTAIGHGALAGITSGDNNVALGFGAGMTLTNAPYCTYIGTDAGKLATGANNVVIGALAFDANANSGTHNVAIGTSAMGASTGAVNYCVAVGEGALAGNLVATGDDPSGAIGIGYQAGVSLTAAIGFTGVGYQAGYTNSAADKSTYIGYKAGFAGNFNHNNTYVGYKSGQGTSGGGESNTGVGVETLANVNGAVGNVAVGFQSLMAVSSGDYNSALGYESGEALTTGSSNISLGYQSLKRLVSGENNVAIGVNAADGMGVGESENIAIGTSALGAMDEGTAGGDIDGNIAIGHAALVGGDLAGNDRQVQDNIAIGRNALNTTSDNAQTGTIAIGADALTALTSGERNTAIGYKSSILQNTGSDNTTLGYQSGYLLTTGVANVFLGAYANGNNGGNVLTGNNNIGIGFKACYNLEGDAVNNVLIGSLSGQNMTTGDDNTAVGNGSAPALTTGARNVAIGSASLQSEDTYGYNTAVGYYALGSLNANANGYNTAVGYSSGSGITTGIQNTSLGASTVFDVDANNQTTIGFGATTDSANDIAIGNTSVDEIKGQVDFSTFSDKRIKTDIKDGDLGLDFINELKVRKFKKVNPAKYPDEIRKENDGKDETGNEFEWTDAQANKVWDGLIAQEVKEAMDKSGTTFSGWSEESNSKQLVTYSTMVMPLIKAVQELSAEIKSLKKQLEDK